MSSTTALRPQIVGWVPLTALAELRAAMPIPAAIALSGRRWALVLLDDEVRALHDVCPHRRVPLSAGRVAPGPDGRQVLECGYHGWSYDVSGACARIPALGEDIVPRGMGSVDVLATAVAGGLVWGCPDTEPGPVPAVSEDQVFLREQLIEASAEDLLAALAVIGRPQDRGWDGVLDGEDALGAFRLALRPLDAQRTALFPLVSAADLPRSVAAWIERIEALPFSPVALNELER